MSEHDDRRRADPVFEQALLRSAALDEPDDAALSRVALSLGVAATTLAVGGAAAAAAAASGAPAAASGGLGASGASGALVGVKSGLGAALWVKPLMIGAALGAVATTGVEVLLTRSAASDAGIDASSHDARARARMGEQRSAVAARAPALVVEPVTATSARAASGAAPPLARFEPVGDAAAPRAGGGRAPSPGRGPELATTTEVEAEVAAMATPPLPVAPPSASVVASAGGSSLREQIEVIDRARSALRAGAPRAALAHLDTYGFRWPKGELALDAQVLRIEARFAAGDRAAARTEALAFIEARPESRYAARLRVLLASEIKTERR